MKNLILKYGLISGTICASWLVGFLLFGSHESFDYGVFFGFGSMIIAFSFIYVAIKKHRNENLNGFIDFKTAFRLGSGIAFIGATIYVAAWLIFYFNYMHEIGDKYIQFKLDKMKAANASQVEIDKYIEQAKQFGETYDNPLVNMLMTYTEILPVGLLITVFCALILRKKPIQLEDAS